MVVLFTVVRFVMNDVTAFKSEAKKLVLVAFVVDAFVAKKLVDVAFVAVSDETVVVARVEVPRTIKRPDVVALPFASTAKFELAVQLLPFQKSVWLLDDPLAIVPEIVVQ